MRAIFSFRLLASFALLSAIISCAPFRATPPEGFAAYDDDDKSTYRAVSPDGVLFRVTEYKQEAEATSEFWRDAFLLKMKNANYRVEDTLSVLMGGKPSIGYLFSVAGNAGKDVYMVVAAPLKDRVIVAEATGTEEQWQVRKQDILKAVNEIEL